MVTRLLPPDEWPRLAETTADLGKVLHLLKPSGTAICVVEDGDEIVGCWSIQSVYWVEGLWIREDHRKRTSVGRRLWRWLRSVTRDLGIEGVMTGAADDQVRDLLLSIDGKKLPDMYYFSTGS